MSNKPIIALIRSGGQTGTDRAALDAGRAKKYPISGWCPKGGWAEDMLKPPGLRKRYPELMETPDEEIMQRTEWNVRDSHVTIVIGGLENSFGATVTVTLANAYERPFIIVVDETPEEVMQWMEEEVGRGLTVNFAGPRESEAPGTQKKAFEFICRMLDINDEEPENDVYFDLKAAQELQMSFTQQASSKAQDAAVIDPKTARSNEQRTVRTDGQRGYPKIDAEPIDPFAVFDAVNLNAQQPAPRTQPRRDEQHARPQRERTERPRTEGPFSRGEEPEAPARRQTQDPRSRSSARPERQEDNSQLPVKAQAEENDFSLDDLAFPNEEEKGPLPAGKPTKSTYVDPFAEFEDVD